MCLTTFRVKAKLIDGREKNKMASRFFAIFLVLTYTNVKKLPHIGNKNYSMLYKNGKRKTILFLAKRTNKFFIVLL